MAVVPPIEYQLGSEEFVRAEVTSKLRTGAQLAALPVEVARVPAGTKPTSGDWGAGAWEANPGNNKAVARRLFTYDELGRFDIYTRHTDNPEVPIKLAGSILVK